MPTSDLLQIRVNGELREVATDATVGDLVDAAGRDRRLVAVERNGSIVSRDQYDETELAADDRLEIVQFVQGG